MRKFSSLAEKSRKSNTPGPDFRPLPPGAAGRAGLAGPGRMFARLIARLNRPGQRPGQVKLRSTELPMLFEIVGKAGRVADRMQHALVMLNQVDQVFEQMIVRVVER